MAPNRPPTAAVTQGFRPDRDDRGFADINAYYHLDPRPAPPKALGFTDLIPGALGIDTDAGYQDNSSTIRFERRLELGRSGVPDAEDPMVIWHEFGHGVQHHILPDLGEEGYWGHWRGLWRLPGRQSSPAQRNRSPVRTRHGVQLGCPLHRPHRASSTICAPATIRTTATRPPHHQRQQRGSPGAPHCSRPC